MPAALEAAKLRLKREIFLPLKKQVTRQLYIYKMPEELLKNWEEKSGKRSKVYRNFLLKVNKNNALRLLPALHEDAFNKINCLECGRCCKNYSPRFKTPDIKRIAAFLKMKEGEFIEAYLKLDEEGDYVVQTTPCPFLEQNNKCSIYDHRPGDCRRFPYTDEDVFIKRQQLTLKNVTFCPIAYHVLEGLIEET